MCNFRVGQKVAYVGGLEGQNSVQKFFEMGGRKLRAGDVFTVREVRPYENLFGVFLEEVHNPIMDTSLGFVEVPYPSHLFRPIFPKKTDIEIFRRMLNTTPEQVGA